MKKIFFLLFLGAVTVAVPQKLQTPAEAAGFRRVSSHAEMKTFLEKLQSRNKTMQLFSVGYSSSGKELYAFVLSKKGLGRDKTKMKVLLFAQQHGDEPSGKEALLLLLRDFANGKLGYLLDSMDLFVIPQMNPDGAEKNERRNGQDKDLNRDHLLLETSEARWLHDIYHTQQFDVSLDMHEYSPASKAWREFGYLKAADEQFGALTNPNTPRAYREYTYAHLFPYVEEKLKQDGFSFQEYIVGSPAGKEILRRSTVDINDGRQSFGILGTWAFILEGRGGTSAADNLKHRSLAQYSAAKHFLAFMHKHRTEVMRLVAEGRGNLIGGGNRETVIRMEHASTGKPLTMLLRPVKSQKDTAMMFSGQWRDTVAALLKVTKPDGYLFPKSDTLLFDWMMKHHVQLEEMEDNARLDVEQYVILGIDTIDAEGVRTLLPEAVAQQPEGIRFSEYYFAGTNQIHSEMLPLALEPQSMLSLCRYPQFSGYLKAGQNFPLLRAFRKK